MIEDEKSGGKKSAPRASVTVSVNGTEYPMACAPGEEKRIIALGKQLDAAARRINHHSAPMAESRLLVMAALLMADELAGSGIAGESTADEDAIAERIEAAAAKAENLAGGE